MTFIVKLPKGLNVEDLPVTAIVIVTIDRHLGVDVEKDEVSFAISLSQLTVSSTLWPALLASNAETIAFL